MVWILLDYLKNPRRRPLCSFSPAAVVRTGLLSVTCRFSRKTSPPGLNPDLSDLVVTYSMCEVFHFERKEITKVQIIITAEIKKEQNLSRQIKSESETWDMKY